MRQKSDIAPRQGYRGWADMESVEYKYPRKGAVKYVLRISLVGSSPRVWREIAVPSTIKLTSLAHVIILAMGQYSFSLAQRKRTKRDIPPTKAFPRGKDANRRLQKPPIFCEFW